MKATLKKEMVGLCKVCGKRHVRPSPANMAVCAPNGVHNKAVEVVLEPAHPTFRFEVSTEVKK